MSLDIGKRLREMREMRGLSQRALAKLAGMASGTVSLIEQNRTSPSVATLTKLLEAVPMSLTEFFSPRRPAERQVFFHATEFHEISRPPVAVREVGGSLSRRAFELRHERYDPGADTGTGGLHHPGQEAGIVVQGRITLTVGHETRELGAGDGYYFDAERPHRLRNAGEEVCEIVSVICPPRPW